MEKEDIERVIEMWKNHILVEELEGYDLEIEEGVPESFAAIALYLDSKTVRAMGAGEDYYEGYRHAAMDVLNLIGVELGQDDEIKVVQVKGKESERKKQKKLLDNVWDSDLV